VKPGSVVVSQQGHVDCDDKNRFVVMRSII